ncbi:MAG: prolipoprotein diacylglyceryl transferase [Thermoanaerobaculia bacterium]
MHPVVARLGPLTIYSYGLMVAAGFWTGSWIAAREYARRGGRAEDAWRLCFWMLVGAFVVSHGLAIVSAPEGPSWRSLFSGAVVASGTAPSSAGWGRPCRWPGGSASGFPRSSTRRPSASRWGTPWAASAATWPGTAIGAR